MKGTGYVWLATALIAVVAIAGVSFTLASPRVGSTSSTGGSSSRAISVSSIDVQKQGPYGGLLSVAVYDRNDSSCSNCVSEATIGLLYLNSGDDGMQVTNTTAIRVTVALPTSGFQLVNITLPHVGIASNPVYLPQEGEVDVWVYYINPSTNYSGPIVLSFDAQSGG